MNRTSRDAITRRVFVKGTTGILAATWITDLSGCTSQLDTPPSSEIGIGVQLDCFRQELAEDYAGTLANIAGLGYKGVEFTGAPEHYGHTARELRTMLDDSGLKPCGIQVPIHAVLGEELEKSVGFNQILGNNNLIVRSMSEKRHTTREALIATANVFNELAEKLRPFDMRLGFHMNGDFLEKLGGAYKWNIFADHTSENVILQIDTAIVSQAEGVDLVSLLKKYPGRHTTVHVKPTSSSDPGVYFDEDELDWPALVEVFRTTAGVEWYIIDNEISGTSPLEASKAGCVSFVLKTGIFGLCSCLNDTEMQA